MTIIQERLEQLESGEITLDRGEHEDFESGHCAMEVVSWLAGQGHTDAPECASPVMGAFTIRLNDEWEDEQRQKIVPLLPRMVGTAGDGQDEARSYLALDWLIRTYTPAWLDLAGMRDEAQELRDLRRIADLVAAERAGDTVRKARDTAWARGDAARDAAEDAAEAAAVTAAVTAARDAAWAAARDAAVTAARDAARDAAWAAAVTAAEAAAVTAAWDAAVTAARDAARDALQPTVESLQASALDLLDRMINPSATESEEK